MSDKKHTLFTAVIGIIVLAIVSISLATGYDNALEDIAQLEERLASERDSYYAEIFARPRCKDIDGLRAVSRPLDETRIEYLEGQLDSCNRAYSKEKHDRLFYQNALDEIPAYCPEGLYDLTIAGLVDERNYCWGILDRIRERRGAPCHSRYDGIRCFWETPPMLYDCAFGEIGWIGPDRVMCDEFGNTLYREARAACYSDRNCSSCLEMTKGDLGHCYAFAHYP